MKYVTAKNYIRCRKRLQKITKRAERSTTQRLCRDGVGDLLRYTFSKKYVYKQIILGKTREFWNTVFACSAVAVALVTILILMIL